MNFDHSYSGVVQGRQNQAQSQETPNTFAKESGADRVTQMSSLDKPKQRMAGELGHRLKEYLGNPMERARTDQWMMAFGVSNEGAAFNAAKMGVAPGQPGAEQ